MSRKVTPEQAATDQVLLGASEVGARLLRNNSGGFYDDNGRFIHFGLGNDGSTASKEMAFGDYIGGTPVTITPEMVGKKIFVFTMIEVKPACKLHSSVKKALKGGNSREAKQLRAIEWVRDNGGIAWFASTKQDVQQVINLHIEGFKK